MGKVYLVYIVEEGTANQTLVGIGSTIEKANKLKEYAETDGNYFSDVGWEVEIRVTDLDTVLLCRTSLSE